MRARPSREAKYKAYLLPGEKLERVFHLGVWKFRFNTVLATNRRILIIRKFPRNLTDIDYPSIEIVEYYTNVEWIHMLFSLLLWILAALFFVNRTIIIQSINDFFPPIAPVLTSGQFLGLNAGSFLLVGVFVAGAIYHMGFWVISFFGKLRLIMFDQAPIDVMTSFSEDTQKLIKRLEQRKPTLFASRFREKVLSSPRIGALADKGKKKGPQKSETHRVSTGSAGSSKRTKRRARRRPKR